MSLVLAGVALCGAAVFSLTLRASPQGARVLFSEAFDDEPIGATPFGVSNAGGPCVTPLIGSMTGEKSPGSTALNVIREDGINVDGNCLSLVDDEPGPGGVITTLLPDSSSPGTPVYIAFTVRREDSDSSSQFQCCAIDNRTTPGTGRMASVSMFGADGLLKVGTIPTGYRVAPGVDYRIEMSLYLQLGSLDSWRVRVTNTKDPSDTYTASGLRLACDGANLTSLVFSVSALEHAAFSIDDVSIEEL